MDASTSSWPSRQIVLQVPIDVAQVVQETGVAIHSATLRLVRRPRALQQLRRRAMLSLPRVESRGEVLQVGMVPERHRPEDLFYRFRLWS